MQKQSDNRTINLLAVCLSIQFCLWKTAATVNGTLADALSAHGVPRSGALFTVATEGAQIAVMLIAFLFPMWLFFSMLRGDGKNFLHLRPTLPLHPLFALIFSASLATAMLAALDRAVILFPHLSAPAAYIPQGVLQLIFCFVRLVLLPALVGEIFCRGLVLGSLLPWGRTFAIVFSALISGLSADNLPMFVFFFVIGMIAGYFVTHTGSLWIGIFISLICNTVYFLYSFAVTEQIALSRHAVMHALIACLFLLGVFSCVKIDDQFRKSRIPPVKASERNGSVLACLAAPCMLAYYILVIIYF